MSIIIEENPVFLPRQTLNKLRRDALSSLKESALAPYRRTVPDAESDFRPAPGACAEGRRRFSAVIEDDRQLAPVLECDFITRIYLDCSMYPRRQFVQKLAVQASLAREAGRQAYLVLPAVFRMDTARFYREQRQSIEQAGIGGYLVKNMDELGFLEAQGADKRRCVLDHSLYACSCYTKYCYNAAGWSSDTIPLELNRKELLARDNTASELVIYGRMPLMISAQCLHKTFGRCAHRPQLWYLKDRYANKFPVKNNCSECCNIIYNSRPLSLLQLSEELGSLQPASYRLHFTIESADEVRRVLDCCRQSFFEHKTPDMEAVIGAYTYGHYKRGVE